MDFKNMTRQELILYLYSFIEGMVEVGPRSEEEMDFIQLQKRVIFELIHTRVYCVKSTRYKSNLPYGKVDFDEMYFSSLHQAKRELKNRRRIMEQHFPLAEDWEIVTGEMKNSLLPNDYRSIVDNSSVKLEHTGRFKFVEGRLRNGRTKNGDQKVEPILMSLTEIPLMSAEFSGFKKSIPQQDSPDIAGKKIISFRDAQRSTTGR